MTRITREVICNFVVHHSSLRYFLEIAFNGQNYFGWQRQPQQVSVQETLEHALSTLLRSPVTIVGAGRTDAGVHARQIFAHFDIVEPFDPQNLMARLNGFLPKDISVNAIFEAPADAHARFDAVYREYQYVLTTKKDPFLHAFSFGVHQVPEIIKMNEAAAILLEHTDFQCFSKSKTDVRTYNCQITKAQWTRQEDTLIFTIGADRFLRNMVRAIVGTLLAVGYGKMDLEDFRAVLASKDRSEAGASVPGHALFLTKVTYPNNHFKL